MREKYFPIYPPVITSEDIENPTKERKDAIAIYNEYSLFFTHFPFTSNLAGERQCDKNFKDFYEYHGQMPAILEFDKELTYILNTQCASGAPILKPWVLGDFLTPFKKSNALCRFINKNQNSEFLKLWAMKPDYDKNLLKKETEKKEEKVLNEALEMFEVFLSENRISNKNRFFKQNLTVSADLLNPEELHESIKNYNQN